MAESGPAGAGGGGADLEILQIIPALNHEAIYAHTSWESGSESEGFLRYPVACWALVLDPRTGRRAVCGMEADVGPTLTLCEDEPFFVGYALAGREPSDAVYARLKQVREGGMP
jgi:hypothetical protein